MEKGGEVILYLNWCISDDRESIAIFSITKKKKKCQCLELLGLTVSSRVLIVIAFVFNTIDTFTWLGIQFAEFMTGRRGFSANHLECARHIVLRWKIRLNDSSEAESENGHNEIYFACIDASIHQSSIDGSHNQKTNLEKRANSSNVSVCDASVHSKIASGREHTMLKRSSTTSIEW